VYIKFKEEDFDMNKIISVLLTLAIVASSTTGVFAANNTNKDGSLTSSEAAIVSTENLEQLAKQKLTKNEKEKVKNDYNYLRKLSVDVGLIHDIEVVKNGKNVYKLEFPNNIKEDVTVEHKDGEYIMDVSQGKDKSDNLVLKGKDIYLDGNKVLVSKDLVSKEDVLVSKGDVSAQDIIVPMADRDEYVLTSSPYGVSADYDKYQYTNSTSSIYLSKQLKDLAMATLVTIVNVFVFVKTYGVVPSYVALNIINAFPNSTSYGLSFKNYVYYHKNGHYLTAVGGYVQENYVRWYENTNFLGRSKVIPTYTVLKLY
jgi:hypothetical protein